MARKNVTAGVTADASEVNHGESSRSRCAPQSESPAADASSVPESMTITAGSLSPFLAKLQSIIAELPRTIGCWSKDGLRFDIVDESAFLNYVTQHYGPSKEATFIRQLHYYGFRKLDAANGGGDGITGWSFMHEDFDRDRPEAIYSIKRRGERDRSVKSRFRVKQQSRVTELEDQVSSLRSKVTALQRQLAEAKKMSGNMEEVTRKRRKLEEPQAKSPLEFQRPPALSTGSEETDEHVSHVDAESLFDLDLSNKTIELGEDESVLEQMYTSEYDLVDPLPMQTDALDLSSFADALAYEKEPPAAKLHMSASPPAIEIPSPEQLATLLPMLWQLPVVQQALLSLPRPAPVNDENRIALEIPRCLESVH